MEVYIFRKAGFRDRQSEKLKSADKRQAILVDSNLNNDPKMFALYAQKDVTLLGILFEIWANLDLETETWEVSKDHFDHWIKKTFSCSNRFDVLKRLHWLSNNLLIEFKQVPNDLLTDSYSPPNDLLTTSKTPLEQGETLVALRATKPTNQANQANSLESSQEIEKAIEYIRTHAANSALCNNVSWANTWFPIAYRVAQRENPQLKPDDILACWMATCDYCFQKKERIKQPYMETTFKSKLLEFNPSEQPKEAPFNPMKPTRLQRLMAAKVIKNFFDGEELQVSTLRLDRHNQLWNGLEKLELQEFEPIKEGETA